MKECQLTIKHFGNIDGEEVFLYQLTNGEIDIEITNYGCTIVSVFTPDKWGEKANIVAGFNNISQYQQEHPYLGCIIGRFANRIAYGKFSIDGIPYQLTINNDSNHLHGGRQGFNKKVWKTEKTLKQKEGIGITFSYVSKDGEEGYPGNMHVNVSFTLNSQNQLSIRFDAAADRPTIVSLTNHSYFNLTGFKNDTIYDHLLQIHANRFTVKNENNTPSGKIAFTKHTPLHFYTPKKVGEHIHQLDVDKGYDHNFVLQNDHQHPTLAAHVWDEASGRSLKVFTNQPGMQLYSANWWNEDISGYHGKPYCKHGALALETQAFPDAPNHPRFPNALLRPGENYRKETVFQFSNKDTIHVW